MNRNSMMVLNKAVAAGVGPAVAFTSDSRGSFLISLSGPGPVSATVKLEVSDDPALGWESDGQSSIALSGTSTATEYLDLIEHYRYVRASVLALSAGATVSVVFGDQVSDGPGIVRSRTKAVTAQVNLTGGSDFLSEVSTLKLPAGVTDLTSGVGGGGGGGVVTLPNNSIGLTIPQVDGKTFTIVTNPTTYNGHIDNSMSIGYNRHVNGSLIPTEPYAVHTLETDYYDVTIPNRSIEWYYAIGNPDVDGAVQFRPYGWNYDRANGKTQHYFRSSIFYIKDRANTFNLVKLTDSPIATESHYELRGSTAGRPTETIWGALGQTANIWEIRSERGVGSGNVPIVSAKDDVTGNGVLEVSNLLGQMQARISGNNSTITEFTCSSFLVFPKTSGGGALAVGANASCASMAFQTPALVTKFEMLLVTDFRLDHKGNGLGIYNSGARSVSFPSAGGINVEVGPLKLTTVGNGFYIKEGTNACMGAATLSAGAVVVNTTKVTASSRIFLTTQSLGTVTAPKAIAVTGRSAGTSFTITSSDATDTSIIAWEIKEPA